MKTLMRVLLFAAVSVASVSSPAVAGWYLDSIQAAPMIEIRGETSDSAVSKTAGDKYLNDNLDVLLAKQEWLIVNFCAYWCGDCNHFAPFYQQASAQPEYKAIRWARADVDGVRGNEGFRKRFNLPGTPTIILFHKAEIVKVGEELAILDGSAGDKTYEDLIAFLDRFLSK